MKMNHRNQYEETYDKVEGVVSVPYQAKGPIPNYQNIAPYQTTIITKIIIQVITSQLVCKYRIKLTL